VDRLNPFVDLLRSCGLVEPGVPVSLARAPGRLDVMGGIADYSGSLVLQRTIAEATCAAVQRIDRPVLHIVSVGRPPCELPLDRLLPSGVPIAYDEACRMFARGSDRHWVSYVAGLFVILARERAVTFSGGARIVVASEVPEGAGVSSSAALETAVMHAITDAFGIAIAPRDIALLCQKAENLVAGAPCGVMDQMTCILGQERSLLALLCQPAELQPVVPVPADVEIWGIESGERHAVGGSDYASVRAGAFIGFRMLRDREGVAGDYLANVDRARFERDLVRHLPEEMSGEEFIGRYGRTADPVTVVEPRRTYKIRQPTAHPVYEHERIRRFRDILGAPADEDRRVRAGSLMYESHESYGACGLGAPGTDLLVNLARSEGPAAGIYGARITGGGSGGTVAVLGRSDAGSAIERIAEQYARATGHHPHVFSGTSPGAAAFGVHCVRL
jgi:L-arabinokinase